MEEKIVEILSKYQGISKSEISMNSRLIQDIGLSSFDVVSLVCNFEDEFKIEIPDRDIVKVRTVEDVLEVIKKCKKI